MTDGEAGVLISFPGIGSSLAVASSRHRVRAFLGHMDGSGGRNLALQGGAIFQVDGHGNGSLSAIRVGFPTGGVEDVAGQIHVAQVVGTGLGTSGSGALGGPARILLMGRIEGERGNVHTGGGIVIVHGLDQDTVAGIQLAAGGNVGFYAAAGLMKNGGITGIDHSAILQGQNIGLQSGVLMHHKTEGVGVDGGILALGGGVGGQGLTIGPQQVDGHAGLHGSVGGIAAGQDIGIGTHSHIHTVETLIRLANGVGTIAGTIGIGVGGHTSGAVLGVEGTVSLQGVVGAGQGHIGVDHIELHIAAGVGGQNGPLGGAHIGVNHRGGGIVAHQVGGTGSAHNTQDPGRGHHGSLIRRVSITLIQGSAVGVKLGLINDHICAVIRKQGQIAHAGNVHFRVLNGQQAVSIGGNSGTVTREIAGHRPVAIGINVDVGIVNGVIGVLYNDRIEPLPLGLNPDTGGTFIGNFGSNANCIGNQNVR